MTLCGSTGETTSALVQNVQVVQGVPAPISVLPRNAGEDEGGGLNDWNFLNEWNPLLDHRPIASLWRARLSISVTHE